MASIEKRRQKQTNNPSSPKPGETIDLSIESFVFDINRSSISWYGNGKLITQGVGEKTASVVAGKAGSRLTIEVYALAPGGKKYQVSRTITASSVDLIFEGITYTPPFYKGLSLYTPGADVRVVAFPDLYSGGALLDANKLIYTWKVNGKVLGDDSGYGKKSLLIKGATIPKPYSVSVDVENAGDSIS